jgi:hypothetical protein
MANPSTSSNNILIPILNAQGQTKAATPKEAMIGEERLREIVRTELWNLLQSPAFLSRMISILREYDRLKREDYMARKTLEAQGITSFGKGDD